MGGHDIIERLEKNLDAVYEQGQTTGYLTVGIEDAKVLLRMLKMYCWGVGKGDTVTISRKNDLGLAMVVRDGEAFASIEGNFDNPIMVIEAVEAMLDDLRVVIDVMIDEMEKSISDN